VDLGWKKSGCEIRDPDINIPVHISASLVTVFLGLKMLEFFVISAFRIRNPVLF
jgi:hypothetical protein